MELFDTHCHLDQPPLAAGIDDVLRRARERDVTRVLVPAYDLDSWANVAELGGRARIVIALGLHPWVADQPLRISELRAALVRTGAVAIGEIGLDAREGPPLEVQRSVLRVQLDLAAELGLPVILHCRGWFEELIGLIEERAPLCGVVHAFSRGPDLASRFLALGLHIAYGGAVTREGSRAVRSAPMIPGDRLLLETDAPSIGLAGVPAAEVEPHHVRDVAERLAELRAVSVEELARQTSENARALFGTRGDR
jgi:TatD DNase family protein